MFRPLGLLTPVPHTSVLRCVSQMADAAKDPLGVEHRNLLSVAYKNVVGACRASWRALNAYAATSEVESNDEMKSL